jgi:transposase
MSLHPHIIVPVPEETARVARAAFPKGHPYLTFRDALGTLFQDEDFSALFPGRGQPGLPPWQLALVTIMQFRENLADRQAAEAVRARIDWKYLLSLELTDPGFDFSVLSEFRDRLLAGSAASRLRRDNMSSIAYSEKLNSSTISATLQSTDRHHGIVGQKRSHFQLDS